MLDREVFDFDIVTPRYSRSKSNENQSVVVIKLLVPLINFLLISMLAITNELYWSLDIRYGGVQLNPPCILHKT